MSKVDWYIAQIGTKTKATPKFVHLTAIKKKMGGEAWGRCAHLTRKPLPHNTRQLTPSCWFPMPHSLPPTSTPDPDTYSLIFFFKKSQPNFHHFLAIRTVERLDVSSQARTWSMGSCGRLHIENRRIWSNYKSNLKK